MRSKGPTGRANERAEQLFVQAQFENLMSFKNVFKKGLYGLSFQRDHKRSRLYELQWNNLIGMT